VKRRKQQDNTEGELENNFPFSQLPLSGQALLQLCASRGKSAIGGRKQYLAYFLARGIRRRHAFSGCELSA
jgi:hypothetical protein